MTVSNESVLKIPATTPESGGDSGQLDRTHPDAPALPERVLAACPHCGATLSVRRAYMGGCVRCKGCKQTFLLPTAPDGQPTAVYAGIPGGMPGKSQEADLNSKIDRIGTANQGLLDQLAQFIATYDELRLGHDELQVRHTRVEADRHEFRERLKNVTDELNGIRAELGPIAPADVRPLAAEREALSAETHRLRDDNQALLGEQSKQQALMAELEKRVVEIIPLRQEREALGAKVERQQLELGGVRAERDALADELRGERAALVAANAELCRLKQQLEQTDQDLRAARDERAQTTQELDLCKNDLNSLKSDQARLNGEWQNAKETIERLTKTVAERDRTISNERDQFNTQLAGIRKVLGSAERTLRDERERLQTELASLSAQHDRLREEHRSAESLSQQLQSKNAALSASQVQLAADYKTRLESERIKQQELVNEVLQLRADSQATDRAIEDLITTTLRAPVVPTALPDELDAARVQAENLKRELAELKRRDRTLAESLESMGIHVKTPGGR
jgi:chromosome segregation ATPase